MRIDTEDHKAFLLELLANPKITVPLPVAEVVVEVRKAVESAEIGSCACGGRFAHTLALPEGPED